MTYPIPITCRFCMNSDYNLLLDIYEVDAETNIVGILFNLNFEVNKDDGLPSLICRDCFGIIINFYNFKQKCISVENNLRLTPFSPNCELPTNNSTYSVDIDKVELEPSDSLLIENSIHNMEKDTLSIKSVYADSKIEQQNKHRCDICGRLYKKRKRYEIHILTHNGLNPFKCVTCHKQFTRKENLNIHIRTHLGIRPYMCDICGKSSTKRQDLLRHMKVHSDDRNVVCKICNYKFKRSGDLIVHMRTHTGARPYCCKECSKTYTSHSALRKHSKIHIKNV